MYVPSLVTWWRLRSLVLLSALSALSFFLLLSSPNPISCSTIAGLSRECSLPRFRTPFSSIVPSRPLPPSRLPLPFFVFCVRSNAIHRRRALEASLPFSSISTRLIARSRTTGIELLAVGDPLASSSSFFLICETRSPSPCLVAPACTEGSALSPSSVINSVNDQIYGGQRRRRWRPRRNENQRLKCRAVFPHDEGCMLNERFIGSHCYTCFLVSLLSRHVSRHYV